jgi:hypothetical protein
MVQFSSVIEQGREEPPNGCRNHRAGWETVQGAGGQGGHDVRAADGEDTISGKLSVETLSDMGTEVTALEGTLSKVRQVKQGMMSVSLGEGGS